MSTHSFCLLVGLCSLGTGFGFVYESRQRDQLPVAEHADRAPELADDRIEQVEHKSPAESVRLVIRPDSSVYQTLVEAGVDSRMVHEIVVAAKPVFDLSRMPSRSVVQLSRQTDGVIDGLEFVINPIRSVRASRAEGRWTVEFHEKKVDTVPVTFEGELTSTLWESAAAAGMSPQTVSSLADIFAWQIDFGREPRVGDRWYIVVEKKSVAGQIVGWGNILMARYWLQGRLHTAVRHTTSDGRTDYFGLDGASLRGRFLKSPLRFSRISSRFRMKRYHPILKINRPHYGVDYAAPKGTPVRSVGDGTIVLIGRRGGAGNMIKIRHNATYETAYLHLNGFARGLRRGARVAQGQVIGYVGMTGLAAGPHLHFEFYENGRYKDPLGIRFPREKYLDADEKGVLSRRVADLARRALSDDLWSVSL